MDNNIKILPRYRVEKANKKHKKKIKRTTEEYKKELLEINANIEPVEEYVDAKTPILHKCKIHNIVYKAIPSNVLKGCGCKQCGKEKIILKNTKTHEQYKKELNKVNPYITPIEEYVGCNTSLKHLCTLCNNIFLVLPTTAIYKKAKGCPDCRMNESLDKKRLTIEKYKQLVNVLNSNIEVVDNVYINNSTPLKHKCKICDYIFDSIPANILSGHGCKKCAIKKNSYIQTKTNKQFIIEFYNKNPYSNTIEILTEYIGSHSNINCLCKICSNIWSPLATNLLKGSGCPNCKSSYGEFNILTLLKNNNIAFEQQKKFNDLRGVNNGLLSYDFYLPQYNLLIEYQGKQHEQAIEYFGGEEKFKIQQDHDKYKREYAKQNNINLLEIWYYDIDNIESILLQKINEIKENNLKLESVETVMVA